MSAPYTGQERRNLLAADRRAVEAKWADRRRAERAGAHTPGPWGLNTQYADIEIRGPQDSGVLVAVMAPWGIAADAPDPQIANARLIAAAPELLEGCRGAMHALGELPPSQATVELFQFLQAAIAKATGSAS